MAFKMPPPKAFRMGVRQSEACTIILFLTFASRCIKLHAVMQMEGEQLREPPSTRFV